MPSVRRVPSSIRQGTPSAASAVVLGCASNGKNVWKTEQGLSLNNLKISFFDRCTEQGGQVPGAMEKVTAGVS